MISGKQIKPGTVSYLALNADVLTAPHIATALAATQADIAVNNRKLTLVADPVASSDAATKAYVDSTAQGLDIKASVRALASSNVDEATGGEITVDGVNLVSGDRVLLIGQTNAAKNGIWVVATGAWSRASDAGAGQLSGGSFTFVEEGTANSDSGWVLTTDGTVTVGTTPIAFSQFSGAGQVVAGSGLSKTGNTLSVSTINDAQHGSLSGGTLHAVATQSVAGFMSAADKVALDGLPATISGASADAAALVAQEASDRADAITAASDALNTSINNEVSARQSAVSDLTDALTGETGLRAAADTTLTTQLGAEALARSNADSAETAARIAADSAETAARIAADSAETSARSAADSAESTARVDLENALTALIGQEVVDRQDAVQGVTDALGLEASTRNDQIVAEQIARIAAVGGLTTAISGQTLYPRETNRFMVALATTGDGQLACTSGLAFKPVLSGYVEVSVNGVGESVGNGSKSGVSCYFSADGGTTAKTLATLAADDQLYWNGSVAQYDLATDDTISFAVFA